MSTKLNSRPGEKDRIWVARYNPGNRRPMSKTEWSTPWDVFYAIHYALGAEPRTVDAAASSINTKAERFFGLGDPNQIGEDGMVQSWYNEHVWLNPPFGQAADRYQVWDWVNKCLSASAASVMMILPGAFEQHTWFNTVYDSSARILLLQPRVQYGYGNNPSNSMLAYWGDFGKIRDLRVGQHKCAPLNYREWIVKEQLARRLDEAK